jgi:hypothetical protein
VSTTSLSLYQIDLQLLELMHAREEMRATEMPLDEAAASINAIDQQIAEYLPQALANRSDEVANVIRQFEAMDEADAKELARIRDRRNERQEARQYLERRVLELMKRSGKKRIEGQHVTLTEKKNPASVDVSQPDMVPEAYKRVGVTLSLDLWNRVLSHLMPTERGAPLFQELMDCKVSAGEVMLSKVKDELKAGVGVPGCRLRDDSTRLEIK